MRLQPARVVGCCGGISARAREKALLSGFSLSQRCGARCDAAPSTLMNMKCDRGNACDGDETRIRTQMSLSLSLSRVLTVQYMKKAPRTITRNKTGLAARTTCNKSFRLLNHAPLASFASIAHVCTAGCHQERASK